MCTATYVNVSNEVFQTKETVYGITTAIQLGTEDDESHKVKTGAEFSSVAQQPDREQ